MKQVSEAVNSRYNPSEIEPKWQKVWQESGVYKTDIEAKDKNYYMLVELAYTSGDLHMGHWFTFTYGDVLARLKRMQGYNVLFPNGYDAFGLPAENAAIKKGIHPKDWTYANMARMTKQFHTLGASIDWRYTMIACDPDYYKWNQWIFLQLLKNGLAYRGSVLSNWCPSCQTVLANENVENGHCWRCGSEVEQKEVEQWFFKITSYADRLLWKDPPQADWPKSLIEGQNKWIGKSEGAFINFPIDKKYHFVLLHGFGGSPERNFFPWLKTELEKRGHTVDVPSLPNTENPTEEEQVGFVLKTCKFDDNTVLYGHSLGSVVAMKVAAKLKKPIAGLVLSGSFAHPSFKDHPRSFENTFIWSFDAEKIKDNAGFIRVVHDQNDRAVPREQGEKIASMLDVPLTVVRAQQEHFDAQFEPEILSVVLPTLTVFTVYPETLFGTTYMVIAPEHPFVASLLNGKLNEMKEYVDKALKRPEIERKAVEKKKTGVFTGSYCINPANGKKVPIWVADYVIASYGTGVVMGVPGSDLRDYAFAKEYNLEIIRVIASKTGDTSPVKTENDVLEEGYLVNSGEFNGLAAPLPAKEKFKDWLEKKGFGKRAVQYHLHDWSISRQRYWGTPIPIIHCGKCGLVPVPKKDLPVELPYNVDYTPKGKPPLASNEAWMSVKCPNCGGEAKRDPETMDTFIDSAWYFFRYVDPENKREIFDKKRIANWMPVDVYIGGPEHTLGHALYSRFITMFFKDLGLVSFDEYAKKRLHHGTILGPDGARMSKSKGNVVNPDEEVKKYGADAIRVYLSFLGPFDITTSWNADGVTGSFHFLKRVWELMKRVVEKEKPTLADQQIMNATVKKVSEDIASVKYNTAIAAIMTWVNHLVRKKTISKEEYKNLLLLLAPFAPHMSEELYHNVILSEREGSRDSSAMPQSDKRFHSIHNSAWPGYDPKMLVQDSVKIVVQVNGRVRDTLRLRSGQANNKEEVEKAAKASEKVQKYIHNAHVKKIIFVPGKIVNFVVNG